MQLSSGQTNLRITTIKSYLYKHSYIEILVMHALDNLNSNMV